MPPLLFSVVTAVRNARGTVAATLASVAEQTWPDKEHVVQDGASTDGTLELVRATAGPIVRLESCADAGIYDAFNRGLRRARGEVVSFLGGDDCFEDPGVLAEVARAFDDPGVDIVFGDVRFVSRDDGARVVRRYRSGRFRPERLRSGVMPAHTATFVRRRLYEQVGEFDTSYRVAGDFEWLVRAFRDREPRYVHVDRSLVRMRVGGASTAGPAATWAITKEFRRACATHGLPTSYPRLLSRLPRKMIELVSH